MTASAKHVRCLAGLILALGCMTASGQVLTSAPVRTGEVYLFRGFANVFSTGMDNLAAKLHGKGVQTRIYNHTAWKTVATEVVRRAKAGKVSYPVIILGHSYGADACVLMANYLGEQGVPVAYAVTFDPSHNSTAGPRIAKLVNYYVSDQDGVASNNVIIRGKGFSGSIDNINVGKRPQEFGQVVHLTVDKNPKLHAIVSQNVLSMTRPRS